MSMSAPAGWYPDPSNPHLEYWWDGTAYTHSRPVAAPPTAPSAEVAPAGTRYDQPAYPAAGYGQPIYPAGGYPPAGYLAGGVSPKSRTIAALLGFFLGALGVDRFYLGNIGLGVAKLLVGWATLGIWPLIDWIIILAGQAHDGQGLAVVNWN